jgi:hypothetical protein
MTDSKPIDYSKIDLSKIDWSTGFHELRDDPPERTTETKINGAGASATQPTVPSMLGVWDAGDDALLDNPPPRAWLLSNAFARRFLSSLIAEGGTGKTALRYAQYLSLATGRELTGERVYQRCRVLIVSLEDNADELRRRIRAVMLHYGIERAELRGWLFLSTPGAHAGKLMALNDKGRPARGRVAAALEKDVGEFRPDLVGLDPFVKTHSVSENDNAAVDDVVQILADLAIKHDIAIDAPHHARKGLATPGDADRGRGAGAMRDAFRLNYTLTTMSAEEAEAFGVAEEQRKLYLRVDNAKVNIAPPMLKARWFRLVGVQLGNATDLYPDGDSVQTVEPWVPPDIWQDLDAAMLNRMLDAIDAGLPDGNRYTDAAKAGEREAWRVVVEQAPDKTEAQAREIIRTWVKTGVLEHAPYRNPTTRKDVKGLRVNAAKRPS